MNCFKLIRICISSVIVLLLIFNLFSQNLSINSNEGYFVISGVEAATVEEQAVLKNSSGTEEFTLMNQSSIPSGTNVSIPQLGVNIELQVTKRQGITVQLGPGELGISSAHCNPDEKMTGGGFGSSSPGIRIKDASVNNRAPYPDEVAEGDVQMSEKLEFAVRGYNPDVPGYTNVFLVAEVYCAKLVVGN